MSSSSFRSKQHKFVNKLVSTSTHAVIPELRQYHCLTRSDMKCPLQLSSEVSATGSGLDHDIFHSESLKQHDYGGTCK